MGLYVSIALTLGSMLLAFFLPQKKTLSGNLPECVTPPLIECPAKFSVSVLVGLAVDVGGGSRGRS